MSAAPVRFVVLGDYGVDDLNELAVANMVKLTLQPEFIVTIGDNCYYTGADLDRTIGKYYSAYIGNYQGEFGAGSVTNRFFPAAGNHDFYEEEGGYGPYTNYFTLPGNERYYQFRRGPVQFFMLNSEANEPDGVESNSVQAQWLSNQLASSTAPWKLVVVHHAPYSSFLSAPETRWPFARWGAHAVLAGHAHNYERLFREGIPYFVNGTGGAFLLPFGATIPGSLVRIDDRFGAMLVVADEAEMRFEFYATDETAPLDSYTLRYEPRLGVSFEDDAIHLTWPTNRAGLFRLQSTSTLRAWAEVPDAPAVSGTNYTLTVNPTNRFRFFRLTKST